MIKGQRNNTFVYLIDITYKYSMNSFYEFYGYNIPYSLIEQESYVELKQMVHEMINDKIKFRKYNREGMILTLKVEFTNDEKEKFVYLLEKNQFKFLHNYTIKDFRILKNEENE